MVIERVGEKGMIGNMSNNDIKVLFTFNLPPVNINERKISKMITYKVSYLNKFTKQNI